MKICKVKSKNVNESKYKSENQKFKMKFYKLLCRRNI